MRQIQIALEPTQRLEIALARLRQANEYADKALAYCDQIISAQENLPSNKKDVKAWAMILAELAAETSVTEPKLSTVAKVKTRHKKLRQAMDNEFWEKD
jgi:hypothetical protein